MSGRPSLTEDLARLKRLAKHAWWIGMALGLVCHFVPPDYQVACKTIVSACTP